MLRTFFKITIFIILLLGMTAPGSAEKVKSFPKKNLQPIKLKSPTGRDSEKERPLGPDEIEMKLFTPGKSWIYKFINPSMPDNNVAYYKYSVEKNDTIVDYEKVRKIRIENLNQSSEPLRYIFGYDAEGCVYQHFRAVYRIEGIEYNIPMYAPIFNFNLPSGSKINVNGPEVMDIYNVNIHGVMRKVQMLGVAGQCVGYWIDGIGSTNPYHTITEFPNETEKGYIGKLVACYDGDECIYQEADFDLLASSGVDKLTPSDSDDPCYYNLQGQRVDKPVKGQLYIRQNGNSTVKIIY